MGPRWRLSLRQSLLSRAIRIHHVDLLKSGVRNLPNWLGFCRQGE
jgi:hypothetical protein